MKKLIIGLCFLVCTNAICAETDYTEMLRQKGHTYCDKAINSTANWVLGQDGVVLSQWNEKSPNEHGVTMFGSKRYKDGNTTMYLTAVPTVKSGCDVSFTFMMPLEQSCTSLRETTFKDWKYFADLQGLPIYEDPTSSNVNVVLQPVAASCVAIKTGMLFYEKDDLK